MPICSSIFPTTSYNCFRVSGLILRSFIHFLSWCWYRVRKQGSQSSTCEYTVFSVIFVEEAVFSPPYVLVSFVKKCHCTFSVCTSLSGSSRGTVWYICAVGRCRFGDCAHSAPEYGPPTGSWACWSRTGWRKWSCIVPGPCAPWPCLLLSGPDEKPAQTPHLSNLCVRIHIQSSTSSLSPPSLLSLANSAAPKSSLWTVPISCMATLYQVPPIPVLKTLGIPVNSSVPACRMRLETSVPVPEHPPAETSGSKRSLTEICVSWATPSSARKCCRHTKDPGFGGLCDQGPLTHCPPACPEILLPDHQVQTLWEPHVHVCPEGPAMPIARLSQLSQEL
jgi:hypothetical protein